MSKKSSNLKFSTELDLKRKFLAELILMDDIFMRVVLKDVKCTEFILQTILEKPELRVKSQSIQSDLKNLEGRSLVLDCLCTDKKGTIYNIELQNDSLGASPKRARYHSGLIDMNNSKKGKSFDYLPESYVIFICGRDVLKGDNKSITFPESLKNPEKIFPTKPILSISIPVKVAATT